MPVHKHNWYMHKMVQKNDQVYRNWPVTAPSENALCGKYCNHHTKSHHISIRLHLRTNNTNAQLFFSLFRFFSHFRSKKVITSLRNINYLTIYLKWMKNQFDMGEDLLFTKKTSRFLSVYVVYLIISRRRIVLYVSRVD